MIIVFSGEELQKGHLSVVLGKKRKKDPSQEKGMYGVHTLYCMLWSWLMHAVHIVNRLWLRLKSSSHEANYLTVHRPFIYPASWKGWVSLTDRAEKEKKRKSFYAKTKQNVGMQCRKQREQTAWAGHVWVVTTLGVLAAHVGGWTG